jgi:uncharacterized protein YqhQ
MTSGQAQPQVGRKLTRRDITNLVVAAVFLVALGYLVYVLGAGVFALVPVVAGALLVGMVIRALRRNS